MKCPLEAELNLEPEKWESHRDHEILGIDYIDKQDLDGQGYDRDCKEWEPRKEIHEWQAEEPVRGTTISQLLQLLLTVHP